jgi:probable rRNA maturation factor
MSISFNTADKKAALSHRKVLKLFITKQVRKEGLVINDLQYVFCSDKYLLDINRQFLDHDFYTDIISFDLSEEKGQLVAEVYISIDRVKDNAKQLRTTIKEELLRVIFHGALHFCGYKDKKPKDAELMRSMENNWLKAYQRITI